MPFMSFRPLKKVLAALLVPLTLAACATVSLDYPKSPSTAISDVEQTSLARYSEAWRAERPDQDAFYPLSRGLDAFGSRLSLIDHAEVSIDAQYFLMKPDDAGLVLATKLVEAAERGVRVRLLLDDVFTTVKDGALALLDEYENIEVRIFNPVSRRGLYGLNYVGNFKLSNRRMHNKSFIVDNQFAIVGGRNIAVEYFQLEASGEFVDFDMLSAGPIVQEVSGAFDRYWNHELAVPLEALLATKDDGKRDERVATAQRRMAAAGDSIYAEAINTELMRRFYEGAVKPYYAESRLVVDDPQKLLAKIADEHKIAAGAIGAALAAAQSEVILFTPYLIPRQTGLDLLREIRQRGVRVVVVTNSLATNNHTAVHSAYASYRKPLLEMGVELWEARADAAKVVAEDGSTMLDRLTLHAKGMVIDRRTVITGSLNFDPRSIDINSELALFLESPELGERMGRRALEALPSDGYRLYLDDRGRITWQATIDGEKIIETSEPQASWWRRLSAWFQKIAPEDQL